MALVNHKVKTKTVFLPEGNYNKVGSCLIYDENKNLKYEDEYNVLYMKDSDVLGICLGDNLWIYPNWLGFIEKYKTFNDKNIKLEFNSILGLENTRNILNNYSKNELKNTIWEKIQNVSNEIGFECYLPTIGQMNTIYKNIQKTKFKNIILGQFLTSSNYLNLPYIFDFSNHHGLTVNIDSKEYSFVLINIE